MLLFNHSWLKNYDYVQSLHTQTLVKLDEKIPTIYPISEENLNVLKEIYTSHKKEINDKYYIAVQNVPYYLETLYQRTDITSLERDASAFLDMLFLTPFTPDYYQTRRGCGEYYYTNGIPIPSIQAAYTFLETIFQPYLVNHSYTKPARLTALLNTFSTLLAIDKQLIISKQLEMQEQSVNHGLETIQTANMELEHAAELQQSLTEQNAAILDVTSSMDELTASINEVSGTVGVIANRNKKSLEELNTNITDLGGTILLLEDANRTQHTAGKSVEILVERVKNVDSMLRIIQDIAEQTNLLALNASIEAARAGDAGKGFAVVANEVRKLADDTKSSTKNINQDIQELFKLTDELENISKDSEAQLSDSVTRTQTITTALISLNKELQNHGIEFTTLVETTTAQSMVSEGVATNFAAFSELIASDNQLASKVGIDIFNLSKVMQTYRLNHLENLRHQSKEQRISTARVSTLHLTWLAYNYTYGFSDSDTLEILEVKDHPIYELAHTLEAVHHAPRLRTLASTFVDHSNKLLRTPTSDSTSIAKYYNAITEQTAKILEFLHTI